MERRRRWMAPLTCSRRPMSLRWSRNSTGSEEARRWRVWVARRVLSWGMTIAPWTQLEKKPSQRTTPPAWRLEGPAMAMRMMRVRSPQWVRTERARGMPTAAKWLSSVKQRAVVRRSWWGPRAARSAKKAWWRGSGSAARRAASSTSTRWRRSHRMASAKRWATLEEGTRPKPRTYSTIQAGTEAPREEASQRKVVLNHSEGWVASWLKKYLKSSVNWNRERPRTWAACWRTAMSLER
mmetsp:Transcript_62752/g.125755  ORF Transcript_62752/g.125755 Transcript_62752/m.125755 type:complete len:238 (+) Transcript_62752:280-993(+)